MTHPYHNNPILNEIKELEIQLRQERIDFEKNTAKPIRTKINQLKAKRQKELYDFERKQHQKQIDKQMKDWHPQK